MENRDGRKEQAAEMWSLAESDRFPGNKSSYIYKYAAASTIWIISHCFLKMPALKLQIKKERTFAKIHEELFSAPFCTLNYPRTIDSEKLISHCD